MRARSYTARQRAGCIVSRAQLVRVENTSTASLRFSSIVSCRARLAQWVSVCFSNGGHVFYPHVVPNVTFFFFNVLSLSM